MAFLRSLGRPLLLAPVSLLAACSSSSSSGTPANHDGGTTDAAVTADAAADAPPPVGCSGPCPASNVKYVVLVVMENHTFDDHFGAYCTAAPGSNPTCNTGPSCCEAAPAKDPSGASPVTLDDKENGAFLPNNFSTCLPGEIDNGAMDKFVTGDPGCSNVDNWVQAEPSIVMPYWTLAGEGAIADRYFQSMAGASSGNDNFFARAGYSYADDPEPAGAIGAACALGKTIPGQTGQTIGDLLITATVPWTFYGEGFALQQAAFAQGACAMGDPACPSGTSIFPCVFDPGDDPFEYYDSTRDKAGYIADLAKFETDLTGGTLPAFSFVKPIGYKTEHPGLSDALSPGPAFVQNIVAEVNASPYASSTLILVTWDEGGGFFDHVAPPATNAMDNQPYGTRIPLIAIGPFAKKNYVSHVVMEHSSIVKFLEWNWLGKNTGQLGTRDTNVNNIGDLLDPTATGVTVPSN